MKRNKFTLIELLIVISIIAVLMGMLLPAFQKARSAAQKIYCAGVLKQYGVASFLYASDYDDFWVINNHPCWFMNLAWRKNLDNPDEDAYTRGTAAFESRISSGLLCPNAGFALRDSKRGKHPVIKSYGLNMQNVYEGDKVTSAKISRIKKPSLALSFADTLGWNITYESAKNFYLWKTKKQEEITGWETIAAYRHDNEKTVNAGLYDGHVQTCTQQVFLNNLVWKNFY